MQQVMAHGRDPLLFHTDFSACNDYRGGLDAAAKVACPAHLVLASQDQMTLPKNARDVAAALKASVHTVPGGHFLMQEQPDAVSNALRKVLA
jgi:surfactin synthase thioesterase subunit